MRYLSITVGLTILMAAGVVEAQGLGQYHYQSRGNISVGRGGYSDLTSPGYSSSRYSGGNYNNHHHYHGGNSYGNFGYGNSGYGYPSYGGYWGGTGLSIGIGLPAYGYSNPYAYGFSYGYGYPYGYSGLSPYGTYYRPNDQYLEYYLPPTQPAEVNYGPQAMKQFMGLPRDFAIEPQRSKTFDMLAAPLPTPLKVAKPVAAIEQPSTQAIERAEHFIQSGDSLFQGQRYQEALGRYKDAVAVAPGYAQAHLRKGLAYLATNRPDEAVESLNLAVRQNPQIADTSLTLDSLLGNNGLAKTSLIEANARRAVADPQNGDLLFCVGVLLYFDGEDETAAKCFAAAKKAGGDSDYIDAFANKLNHTEQTAAGLDL